MQGTRRARRSPAHQTTDRQDDERPARATAPRSRGGSRCGASQSRGCVRDACAGTLVKFRTRSALLRRPPREILTPLPSSVRACRHRDPKEDTAARPVRQGGVIEVDNFNRVSRRNPRPRNPHSSRRRPSGESLARWLRGSAMPTATARRSCIATVWRGRPAPRRSPAALRAEDPVSRPLGPKDTQPWGPPVMEPERRGPPAALSEDPHASYAADPERTAPSASNGGTGIRRGRAGDRDRPHDRAGCASQSGAKPTGPASARSPRPRP
jgi:hypothetical protein